MIRFVSASHLFFSDTLRFCLHCPFVLRIVSIEQAITLFKGPVREYVKQHYGKEPPADSPDPKVRELAAALQVMKNLKCRRMMGLDYDPEQFR